MTIEAFPGRGGRWRVRRIDGDAPGAVAIPGRAALNRDQTQIISECLAALPEDSDRLWRLEIGTSLIVASAHEVGQAQFVADRCASEPDRRHAFSHGAAAPPLHAVRQALRARGLPVAGRSRDRLRAGAAFAAAALVGLAQLLFDMIAYRGTPPSGVPAGAVWVAAQGEWTNRTRHLLARLGSGGPLPLLLIGRPKARDDRIRETLRPHVAGRELRPVRPHSLFDLVGSVGRIARHLREGRRVMARSPYRPPARDLIGMVYRFGLGEVSARWWRRHAPKAAVIVYAHSCNADSSLLERAQQRGGAATVHVFHGLSLGHNFAGISDVGIALCRHDARLHERLGRYRRVETCAADKPAPAPAEGGWLLLTNYAHPMNPEFQARGPALEIAAIRLVAAAAARLGVAARDVVYRPHPAFAGLSEAHRREIGEAVAAAGFAAWPADRPYEEAAAFRCVVTTPSTAAVDLLRLGRLAVVLDLAGTDRAIAHGALPLNAHDLDGLVAAIETVTERHDALLDEAWERIGPGRLPDLAGLAEIALAAPD